MIRMNNKTIRILDTEFNMNPNIMELKFIELENLVYPYFMLRYYRNNNRTYDYIKRLHINDVVTIKYDDSKINMLVAVHPEIHDVVKFM